MSKAAELFGKEAAIVMDVNDARYRYYNWLRGYWGFRVAATTHKCPFYQFMFWGTLVIIATFPCFVWLKFLQYVPLKILGKFFPRVTVLEDKIVKYPLRSSIIVTITPIFLLIFLAIFISPHFWTAIFGIGWALHYVYAYIPYGILHWIVAGIGWTFSYAIIPAIVWIFTGPPWGTIGWWTLKIIGYGLTTIASIWIVYRVSLFLFNLPLFKWFIKAVCDYQKKLKKNSEERRRRLKEWREEQDRLERKRLEQLRREGRWPDTERWPDTDSNGGDWYHAIGQVFDIYLWTPLDKFIDIAGKFCVLIGTFFVRIWEGIKVIFSILTETVSNHCPPIDFVTNFNQVGMFSHHMLNGVMFHGEDEEIYIDDETLPDDFDVQFKKSVRLIGKITQEKIAIHGDDVSYYLLYRRTMKLITSASYLDE